MFARASTQSPDRDALVFETRKLSYAELDRSVGKLAGGLSSLGVTQGDRVGLLMSNRIEFVQSLLACIRLGAIAVPINTRLQTPEIQYVLDHCSASLLIADSDGTKRYPATADASSSLKILSIAEDTDSGIDHPGIVDFKSAHLNFATVANEHAYLPVSTKGCETDPVLLMYTSGTTGRPKGAMVTHLGVIHAAAIYRYGMRLSLGERSIMAVPATHITGITANIFTMIGVCGCTIIMRNFDAEEFISLAAKEKMTHTVIVPAMYKLCLLRTQLNNFDLDAWRIGGYGGAPMPESTIERLAESLPHLELCNIYGATETTGPVVMMPPGHTSDQSDSIGKAISSIDLRIVNEKGNDCETDTKGELLIRGASVVPGYWNDEDANAQNFVDGYWRSGDIGSIDANGYVRLVDRLKDVINRGGYKIYSIEVENALDFHPQVIESAVTAIPDSVLGEKTVAHVRTECEDLNEDSLRNHCLQRLADYKIPDYFLIDSVPLPRNANGKLLKRQLRERASRE